eukprot:gene25176-31605_t
MIISLQSESKVVTSLFEGTLLSRICCYFCGTISAKIDPILDISLDISKASTLENALVEYCEIESLTGHNAYDCATCKKGVPLAEKCLRLQTTPEILIFQRFSFHATKDVDGNLVPNGSSKVNRLIDFPEFLDMEPFIYRSRQQQEEQQGNDACDVSSGGGEHQNTKDHQAQTSTTSVSTLYRLCSVVVHSGRSPHSGHYVAYVRRNDSWFLVDDLHVRRVTLEEVQRQRAYILFYQRVSGDAHVHTQTAMKLAAHSAAQPPPLHLLSKSRRQQYKESRPGSAENDTNSSSSSLVHLFDRPSAYSNNKHKRRRSECDNGGEMNSNNSNSNNALHLIGTSLFGAFNKVRKTLISFTSSVTTTSNNQVESEDEHSSDEEVEVEQDEDEREAFLDLVLALSLASLVDWDWRATVS